ncbi:MAG: GntR family transcriptional regulator, N-acetylglucosamine utilization regulator [Halanaerobiales bacterium]|nr:GntR family transcriptional regulator, N-acetylglucosamine utilization regulator [Halanaerobiales bacterium]
MGLNEASRLPLYVQLKELMKEKIEKGEWKINDKIPSERDLEKDYDVSRMTVRKAIIELVNEGILTRKQGKGTFVKELRIEQDLVKLNGFTQEMRLRGLKPSTRVIDAAEISPDIDVRNKLKLNLGEKVFVLKRLRLANDEPMAYEVSYISEKLCPDLLNHNLNQSLYKVLTEEYNIALKYAMQSLEAGIASKKEADLLNINENDPILILERLTTDGNERPIEFVKSIYRGDKFKFLVRLTG